MAMLNEGLQQIRSLIQAGITKGQLGTDGTTPNQSQTGLITAITSTEQSLNLSGSDKILTFEYDLDSVTGTGNTYKEFEVKDDSDNSFMRIVFTGRSHDSNDELHIKGRFFIKPV